MDQPMDDVVADLRQVLGNVAFVLQYVLEVVLGNVLVQRVAVHQLANRFLLRRGISGPR